MEFNNDIISIIGGADGPTAILVSSADNTTDNADIGIATVETVNPEAPMESGYQPEGPVEHPTTPEVTTSEVTVQTTEATLVTDDALSNVTFEPKNFIDNLGYMATGMVGIFVVIGVIIAATVLMNKIFSGKK